MFYGVLCNYSTIIHEKPEQLIAWCKAGAEINQPDVFGKTPLHLVK
jgi:hypothetical protein